MVERVNAARIFAKARKMRGKVLFDEYKKKMAMVQSEAATPAAKPAERQKIAE